MVIGRDNPFVAKGEEEEMREVGRDEDEKRGGIKPKVRHRDRQTETERV